MAASAAAYLTQHSYFNFSTIFNILYRYCIGNCSGWFAQTLPLRSEHLNDIMVYGQFGQLPTIMHRSIVTKYGVSFLRVFFDFYHVVYAALELYLVGRSKSYHRSLGVPHEKRTKKRGLSYFGWYESYHGRKGHPVYDVYVYQVYQQYGIAIQYCWYYFLHIITLIDY